MKTVKRIEIIIERNQKDKVTQLLDHLGLEGWTVIAVEEGQGDRGARASGGLGGTVENCLVLVVVQPERLSPVLEGLRPLLARWGGVCLVTDALWLKHPS